MPHSGVEIPDSCVIAFNDMKLHKKEEDLFCLVYRISDSLKEFEICKSFKKDPSKTQMEYYEEIMAELTNLTDKEGKSIPSLVIWDLKCPTHVSGGQDVDRLVCMSLCPEEVPIRNRMLFAASKKDFMEKLDGVHKKVNVMDRDAAKYVEFMKSIE